MKVITVKQPWASLIVSGIKDIENRTWKCPKKYIGQRVLIHSGLTIDKNAVYKVECFNGEFAHLLQIGIDKNEFPLGAIIGSVEIVDCVINHPSIWAEKSKRCSMPTTCEYCDDNRHKCGYYQKPIYNWVLANPIKFPDLIPAKGRLGFWDYEPSEDLMTCTNTNSIVHNSIGEREGCRQDCSNCDYFRFMYDAKIE